MNKVSGYQSIKKIMTPYYLLFTNMDELKTCEILIGVYENDGPSSFWYRFLLIMEDMSKILHCILPIIVLCSITLAHASPQHVPNH